MCKRIMGYPVGKSMKNKKNKKDDEFKKQI